VLRVISMVLRIEGSLGRISIEVGAEFLLGVRSGEDVDLVPIAKA